MKSILGSLLENTDTYNVGSIFFTNTVIWKIIYSPADLSLYFRCRVIWQYNSEDLGAEFAVDKSSIDFFRKQHKHRPDRIPSSES